MTFIGYPSGLSPMPTNQATPIQSLAQFCFVVVVAVALPAWWCRILDHPENIIPESRSESQFDARNEVSKLRTTNPKWILIGNSMLNTRIDNKPLSEVSGWPARKLARGGSQSALWFLFLKEIVVASGARPALVTVFFRDTDLTWPDLRIEGNNEDLIAELRGPEQPEWQQVLANRGSSASGVTAWIAGQFDTLFPAKFLNVNARRQMQERALRATRIGTRANSSVRRIELNDRFSLSHLRHDLGGDLPASTASNDTTADGNVVDPGFYEDGPVLFDASPDASFLPHIVKLAHDHGIQLHFHRIKRRPTTSNTRPDTLPLQTYMKDMRAWLEKNGCSFTDETDDARLTLDMYADGDHIADTDAIQKRYLDNFWERVAPIVKQAQQSQRKESN